MYTTPTPKAAKVTETWVEGAGHMEDVGAQQAYCTDIGTTGSKNRTKARATAVPRAPDQSSFFASCLRGEAYVGVYTYS